MSKMIKKEFTPASQISAAFQHYRKASKKIKYFMTFLRNKKERMHISKKSVSPRETECKRMKLRLLKASRAEMSRSKMMSQATQTIHQEGWWEGLVGKAGQPEFHPWESRGQSRESALP